MKTINKSMWIKLGVILILVGSYLFIDPVNTTIKRVIFIISRLDIEGIKGYIHSFGVYAPIVSFLLMMFQSVAAPLPAFLITFANAALFGWVNGAILSWISSMSGAVVCYYIARIYGRETVEKFISKFALKEVDYFFEKHGKYAVLIARLLPFISFDIVSYTAGLTAMEIWPFLWATGLGQLPATVIYSYIGEQLTGGMKIFVFGLLILFSLSILGFLIKKIQNGKNKI